MLTQQELADRADVSLFTVQRIERGEGNVRPKTGRAIAVALGVGVEDLLGKAQAPLPDFEDERRGTVPKPWKTYLAQRVEWCETVLARPPEVEYNNPFLSLETAIQWAIFVGMEHSQLRRTTSAYADAEMHALLDRLGTVVDQTDGAVKAMMDEAGLADEDKRQRLRLIHSSAA